VLARCTGVGSAAQAVLDAQFTAGARVIAVATRATDGRTALTAEDEHDLTLAGFLTFIDRPKADAADALARLSRLDVTVKIITSDNDRVAQKVCQDIGLKIEGALTGPEIERLDGKQLANVLEQTTIFARVTPEQKSRIVKAPIFANTIKYVLMGTSSNFGNRFSAGAASLFLSFLPMLPTQILLNNLLYDASEMAIPTDNVDEEQLQRRAHWTPGSSAAS
jgi:P-type Mg2+ transporter